MKIYYAGRIYKIYDVDDESMFYIGSTSQPLSKRFAQHRTDAKEHSNRPFLQYLLTHKMKIELIELINRQITKEELNMIERKYIQEMKPPLNRYVAGAIAPE